MYETIGILKKNKKKKSRTNHTKFHSSYKRDRIVRANQYRAFRLTHFFIRIHIYYPSLSTPPSLASFPLPAKRITYDHSRRIKVSLAGLKKKNEK